MRNLCSACFHQSHSEGDFKEKHDFKCHNILKLSKNKPTKCSGSSSNTHSNEPKNGEGRHKKLRGCNHGRERCGFWVGLMSAVWDSRKSPDSLSSLVTISQDPRKAKSHTIWFLCLTVFSEANSWPIPASWHSLSHFQGQGWGWVAGLWCSVGCCNGSTGSLRAQAKYGCKLNISSSHFGLPFFCPVLGSVSTV